MFIFIFIFINHILLYEFKLIDICLRTNCEQVLWASIFANSTISYCKLPYYCIYICCCLQIYKTNIPGFQKHIWT